MQRNDVDSDFPIAEAFPPSIPEGDYVAAFVKAETGRSFGNRRHIYLHFRITQGPCEKTLLKMCCTYEKKRMSHRCKYYKQWVLANGQRPQKGERLTTSVFDHKWFLVSVRNTVRRHNDGRALPDFVQYSVVDSIIRQFTG